MMEIVNGYPCFNCADVALAQRNVDPARPWEDPRNPNGRDLALLHPTLPLRPPAVTFGGGLTALNETQGQSNQSNAAASTSVQTGGGIVDVIA